MRIRSGFSDGCFIGGFPQLVRTVQRVLFGIQGDPTIMISGEYDV